MWPRRVDSAARKVSTDYCKMQDLPAPPVAPLQGTDVSSRREACARPSTLPFIPPPDLHHIHGGTHEVTGSQLAAGHVTPLVERVLVDQVARLLLRVGAQGTE